MWICLLTLSVVLPETNTAPKISPLDAVASVRRFVRCVELELDSSRFESTLGRGSRIECYRVALQDAKGRPTASAEVDPTSGDVLYFDRGFRGVVDRVPPPARSDRWLQALGRGSEFEFEPAGAAYFGKVGPYRICNLNGPTKIYFQENPEGLSRFDGSGALPQKPAGPIPKDPSKAIRVAIAQRKLRVPNWPDPLRARTYLRIFYDQAQQRTRWVWQVSEGRINQGKFWESFTNYVDAVSLKPVLDQDIQSSVMPYRSRPARVGIKSVTQADREFPKLTAAKVVLQKLGRPDFHYDSVRIADGVKLYSDQKTELLLSAGGALLEFRAPTTPGRLGTLQAISGAKSLVAQLHPSMPEGRFVVADSRMGKFTSVEYVESALGYDLLDRSVVSLDLNQGGQVARFQVGPPVRRPTSLPRQILSRPQIEAFARALAKPTLPKDTDRVKYSVGVNAGKLGWRVDPGSNRVRLVYMVGIMSYRDIIDWAKQGGGSTYPFDAETGQCLVSFPRSASRK